MIGGVDLGGRRIIKKKNMRVHVNGDSSIHATCISCESRIGDMNLTWMRHAGMLQKQTLVEKESLDLASKLEI